MELERVSLGFRDFVSYFMPGSLLLLAFLLAGWLGPLEKLLGHHPSVLIVGGVIGSYIIGQAAYISRIFIAKGLRFLVGNPHVYLITSAKQKSRRVKMSQLRKSKLFNLLFFYPVFGETFQSLLIAQLTTYWGEQLVKEAPIDVYTLCLRFVREHSAASASYLDRCISL